MYEPNYNYLPLKIFIFAVSVFIIICPRLFEKEQIGAFFEKSEYTKKYVATISDKDKNNTSINAIITINKDGGTYYICSITYDGYTHNFNNIDSIERDDIRDMNFSLQMDYAHFNVILYDSSISQGAMPITNGPICFSKNSDVYHSTYCRYVKTIDNDNKIFLPSEVYTNLFELRKCSIEDE